MAKRQNSVNFIPALDETILWEGKPEKGHLFSTVTLGDWIFMTVWDGFVLFLILIIFLTWEGEQSLKTFLCLIPFLLIGFYIIPVRQFLAQYERTHTRYIITNKRILKIYKSKTEELKKEKMYQIYIRVHKDRTGTIYFDNYFQGSKYEKQMDSENHFKLDYIKDIHKVYGHIRGMEHREICFMNGEFLPGETVLWEGKPQAGHLLTKADWLAIPFSLLWCAFCVGWVFGVVTTDMPDFLILVILPFVCIGVYLLIGRFFKLRNDRNNASYMITNFRIIRSQYGRVDFMDRRYHPEIRKIIHKDQTGTIYFGDLFGNQMRSWDFESVNSKLQEFALENVEQAERVYQIIVGD